MTTPLTIGSSQGNVGDNMFLTPVFRAFPGSTLRMFDDFSCHNVAPLFEGLAEKVEFCAAPGVPPTVDAPTHITERIFTALGRPHESIIPVLRPRPDEIRWARAYLQFHGDPSRMICVHTHNSAWADPSNWFARHIKPPKPLMQRIADEARAAGYKVLQFCNDPWPGKPDNFDPLDGTTHIRGLTLRQTAACYHVIGRMVSGDTGDPYLMLAAGGRVIFLMCPELQQTGYRWVNVAYQPRHWGAEPVRALYYNHSDPKTLERVIAQLSFDWGAPLHSL